MSHLQKYFGSNEQCKSAPKKRLPFFSTQRIPHENGTANNRFHYCEYYYACRSTPCVNPSNTFQKSHDFELNLPVDLQKRHVIQYRNPIGLLISWFEMRLLKNRETDSAEGFRKFAARNQSYLNGFCAKWLDSKMPNRLTLDYDDYLNEPIKHLSSVIQLFDVDSDVDLERLQEITQDIVPAKNNSGFRYYEAAQDVTLRSS